MNSIYKKIESLKNYFYTPYVLYRIFYTYCKIMYALYMATYFTVLLCRKINNENINYLKNYG